MKKLDVINPLYGAPVYHLPVTESTMIDAQNLISEKDFEQISGSGTAIIAGCQTAGRGRYPERRWIAEDGSSLLVTVIIDVAGYTLPLTLAPLVMGLAVADHLRIDFDMDPAVKWPNDVLIGVKKICGVLCELRGSWLLAGIGLNTGQRSFPGDLAEHACSVAAETGKAVDPVSSYMRIAENIKARIEQPEGTVSGINERLYGQGRTVSVLGADGSPIAAGTLHGIGGQGQLLVADSGGSVRECYGGEVVFDL